jgi:hypothetical protein
VLAELETAGLLVLADKGYQCSTYAELPYRGKNEPESQKQANMAHAKLRSPGERAIALTRSLTRMEKAHRIPAYRFRLSRLSGSPHSRKSGINLSRRCHCLSSTSARMLTTLFWDDVS